jgi:hypothetical protein
MKAKEYLKTARNDLMHFGQVRRSIYALYPVRKNRRLTETYLNLYLYADMRIHAGIDGPPRENEVDPSLAPAVRLEILNVIAGDDSFAFARDMIIRNGHMYHLQNDCIDLLLDPPEQAVTRELDAWQKVVTLICEPMDEGHVRIKMKQLLDILIEQHEIGEEKRLATNGEEEPANHPMENAFTVSQVILCLEYMFRELGITEENCHKTVKAELISCLTHKSEKHIRNLLYYDLESRKTKRDLKVIYPVMSKLDPRFGAEILKDLKTI